MRRSVHAGRADCNHPRQRERVMTPEYNSDNDGGDNASPFRHVATATGPALGGKPGRIATKKETRYARIARIFSDVQREIGGKDNDRRDWMHDHAEQRIAEDATDADIAVFVHDWFYRYM